MKMSLSQLGEGEKQPSKFQEQRNILPPRTTACPSSSPAMRYAPGGAVTLLATGTKKQAQIIWPDQLQRWTKWLVCCAKQPRTSLLVNLCNILTRCRNLFYFTTKNSVCQKVKSGVAWISQNGFQRHWEPPDLRGRRAVRHHVVGFRVRHKYRSLRLRRGVQLRRLVHRKHAVVNGFTSFLMERYCSMFYRSINIISSDLFTPFWIGSLAHSFFL